MYDQIARNNRTTILLMVALFLLYLLFGSLIVACVLLRVAGPDTNWRQGVAMTLGASFLATVGTFLYGWFRGCQAILNVAGARPAVRADQPQLFNVVEEMAAAAGIPAPSIYVTDEDAPNAFAVGTSPKQSAVVATAGLVRILSRDELQGVIAHEVAHIRNGDTRLMTLLTAIVGPLVKMAEEGAARSDEPESARGAAVDDDAIVSALLGRRRLVGSRRGGAFYALALCVAVCARALEMAVSRQREYLADATAALLTRYPDGLAAALEKIAASPFQMRRDPSALALLFIVNPSRPGILPRSDAMSRPAADPYAGAAGATARAERMIELFGGSGHFRTHPPLWDRIHRLRGMGLRSESAPSKAWLAADAEGAAPNPGTGGLSGGPILAAAGPPPSASPSSPAVASCPRCRETLSRGSIGARPALGCRQCGGVWMGHADFEAVLKAAPGALDAADRRYPNLVGRGWDLVNERACPLCGGFLTTYRTEKPVHVTLDGCTRCGGVWFDDGELSALAWAAKRKG